MAQGTVAEVSLNIAHKNRDSLLAHLQAKEIKFERIDHVPVFTVEEQAKHVGDTNGALTKNLLLKDKKGRLLLVTALTATKIDLKALSARLGLGKGGLRMAPPEALAQVLQVPPGSCSPLALWHSTARQVGLLCDRGFESHPLILCHPLTNDTSLALSTPALCAFLDSIDRRTHLVDLEASDSPGMLPSLLRKKDDEDDEDDKKICTLHATKKRPCTGAQAVDMTKNVLFIVSPSLLQAEPLVGKDQPPDLAHCLTEVGVVKTNDPTPDVAPSTTKQSPLSGAAPSTPPLLSSQKGSTPVSPPDNVEVCCRRMVERVIAAMPAEAAASLSEEWKKQTAVALHHPLVMFKNAAYAHGWVAGKSTP